MRIPIVLVLSFLVVVIAAKKAQKENLEEGESWSHGAKKYSKEHQKPHHFNHKKQVLEEELANEDKPRAKQAAVEVPEPEVELQGHLETSGKSEDQESQKDLHLQDLTYEEKRHHRAEVDKKKGGKAEKKLFADQEAEHPVDEKVIEDSFEPLEQEPADVGKAKKSSSKDKKHNKDGKKHNKDGKKHKEEKKQKNKKAYEKGKDKNSKKHKDGKKNKDKKHKNNKNRFLR